MFTILRYFIRFKFGFPQEPEGSIYFNEVKVNSYCDWFTYLSVNFMQFSLEFYNTSVTHTIASLAEIFVNTTTMKEPSAEV